MVVFTHLSMVGFLVLGLSMVRLMIGFASLLAKNTNDSDDDDVDFYWPHTVFCFITFLIISCNGPSKKDGGWAFCSGGNQGFRGQNGYEYNKENNDRKSAGRLHILEVQRLIRFIPKIVMAVIPGWTCGGGHSLHVVCEISRQTYKPLHQKQLLLSVLPGSLIVSSNAA